MTMNLNNRPGRRNCLKGIFNILVLVYKQILLVLLSYITTTGATAIITINVSASITNIVYATYLLFKPF